VTDLLPLRRGVARRYLSDMQYYNAVPGWLKRFKVDIKTNHPVLRTPLLGKSDFLVFGKMIILLEIF
jgi:hypothetical protein